MRIKQLHESTGPRYLGISNDGDGPSFKVFDTAQAAYDYSKNDNFGEVVEFTGEILSYSTSGRGETVINGGKGAKTVYLRQDGEEYENDLDLK